MRNLVVFVHGIGDHKAGYSDEWRANFDRYLQLPAEDYIEVVWESVFDRAGTETRGAAGGAVMLTPEEQTLEQEVRAELEMVLMARCDVVEAEGAAPETRGGDGTIEWSDAQTRGMVTWLLHPREYLGDFTRYLASRRVRHAVRERFKERVRPFAADDARLYVISHSWGTVVAYDSLLELAKEESRLRTSALFTLGSPLWAVRRFLDDRSGQKPANVATWVNIHARGDAVGSWLSGFRVDKDYQVPCVGGKNCHSSYFVTGNEQVQRDIVTGYVTA